ncbi:hypothetical protein CH251_12310 [Rhodococcus sp. 06-462-5]|uniref:DUF4913 domain-containing protein n=1 Tax=Nocardiaceae TaxID=85025 RepID=UPI00050C9966|nr:MULTISPECIES: DUF4913 domain-containing protein [Rhodococcus]OZC73912.1 hypothetical protein CH251_12310 [Rhodococcus sp. 06-462-5]OZE67909.1 hypothetical protein CH270_09270 [Rhodococcus sp. 02-925g]OZF51086.1 hypothetical protein CH291_05710 [Rhodococcus sp. 14-1411-2a]
MTAPGAGQEELVPSRFTWRYLDAERARALWSELIDWTTWLRERYELGTKIPPCWYRHDPVVEELSALMAAWTDAYYRGDEYRDDLTAWHTQWFRPLMARVRDISDFDSCTHDQCAHRPLPPATLAGIEGFVDADVGARPEPLAAPPAPVADVTAAEEVRTIPADDMDMAIDSGLAEPLDPADPDSPVMFEGIDWTFNARMGAWAPYT